MSSGVLTAVPEVLDAVAVETTLPPTMLAPVGTGLPYGCDVAPYPAGCCCGELACQYCCYNKSMNYSETKVNLFICSANDATHSYSIKM